MSTLFYVDTIIHDRLLGRKTSFNDRLQAARHLLVEFGERAWRRLECHDRADLLRGDKKHLGCVPLV